MSETLAPARLGGFAAAVSPVVVKDGSSERAVDDRVPSALVEPASVEQVQQTLAEASNDQLYVLPAGGGRHAHLGNVPIAYDIALSTADLSQILDHEPADMTATVESGVRMVDLQSELASHGQQLPLDPPGMELATIGGLLGADVSGPLRHAYGTARDWLIGIRVAHADGSVSKAGGRVVKNVSGYDMHKLYVGSLGSLGVIVEATFKLAALPRMGRTLSSQRPRPPRRGA